MADSYRGFRVFVFAEARSEPKAAERRRSSCDLTSGHDAGGDERARSMKAGRARRLSSTRGFD
jgi:hypothetical protein